MKKITISPTTRISGFLSVDITIDNGFVKDANVSSNLFRGFEKMLVGRNALDASYYTERICGICSTAHAIASARGLEAIAGYNITEEEKIIRDIIHCFDFLQNHIRQFYIFTLPDFVNIPPAGLPIVKASKIPDNIKPLLIDGYIKSLEISRLAHEGLSIFGGKAPHNHGILAGGVSSLVNPLSIGHCIELLNIIENFVNDKMISDYNIIEKHYPEYFSIGTAGVNFLSFGLFNDYPQTTISKMEYIIGDKMGTPNYTEITEDDSVVYPSNETNFNFTKAPRYLGNAMEVGPLARAIISGTLKTSSTMNRIKARVFESKKICSNIRFYINKLVLNRYKITPLTFNGTATGYTDTIRGALLHHISAENNIITNYNIIAPSGWNLSPTDSKGIKGPLETALIGTPIEDETNPIEALRTIHSFDPCVSCATHVYNKNKELIYETDNMRW